MRYNLRYKLVTLLLSALLSNSFPLSADDYITNQFNLEMKKHEQREQRRARISEMRAILLAPKWQDLPGSEEGVIVDAASFRDGNAELKLTSSEGGVSPDAYETYSEAYVKNPKRLEKHRRAYARRYHLNPKKVTVADLVEEGLKLKDMAVGMLAEGAQYRKTGRTDELGKHLVEIKTKDGLDYGNFMAQLEYNAGYLDVENAQQRLRDHKSGKFKKHLESR